MIEFVVLAVVVAIMAAVSTVIGPAGGVVFATMAVVLPAPVVVPVHGAVQSGGSLIRTGLLWSFVDRRSAAVFALAGIVGAVGAGILVARIDLDPDAIRLGLGVATLGPMLRRLGSTAARSRPGAPFVAALGAVTSFLAILVGATGSVVGAALSRQYRDQKVRVATQTSCLCIQHLAKIAVYSSIGFSFGRYLPLVVTLLAASGIGAVAGRRFLTRTDDRVLSAVLELVVVTLGVFLVVTSALSLAHRAAA